jgi:hypothetical protein
VGLSGVLHRHEVGHLSHAVGVEEPRQQDVGVWQVELLTGGGGEKRRHLETSTALRVEQRREDGRRVEVG